MAKRQKVALAIKGVCRYQQKLVEVEVTPRQIELLEKGEVKKVLKELGLK